MATPTLHFGDTFDIKGCKVLRVHQHPGLDDEFNVHFELPAGTGKKPLVVACKCSEFSADNIVTLTPDDHAKLDAADVAAQAAEHAAIRDYNATKHADAPVRMARTLPTWRERVDSL
jgi:hypothetical protein